LATAIAIDEPHVDYFFDGPAYRLFNFDGPRITLRSHVIFFINVDGTFHQGYARVYARHDFDDQDHYAYLAGMLNGSGTILLLVPKELHVVRANSVWNDLRYFLSSLFCSIF
jgi:hypothetical protein